MRNNEISNIYREKETLSQQDEKYFLNRQSMSLKIRTDYNVYLFNLNFDC